MTNTVKRPLHSSGIDMCSGPMLGKIIRFVLPLVLSRTMQLLFNAADIVVVSRFRGDSALAAVGSTTSLINLMLNIFFGFSTATNIIAARHIGERNYTAVEKVVHTSILLSAIAGVFVAIFGVLISGQALLLMKSPENVIALSSLYFKIYCLGFPASIIYNFGSALLNSEGNTKKPLLIITASGIINVALNLVFVVGFGMSVDGVALATIISQYVSAFCVIFSLTHSEGIIRLDFKKLKLHKKQVVEITRLGIPAGIQGMVFSVSNVIIQSSVNFFGKDVMAAYAAANNIQNFLYAPMNSFYQANLTFTSQNFGAKKFDRVKRAWLMSVSLVTALGICLGTTAFCFAEALLKIYATDPAVIGLGVECAMFLWLPVVLCGIMETAMGGTRGLGYTFLPMIVAMLGACGTRILWVSTVFRMYPYTNVLFLAYPISWGTTAIIHAVCYMTVYKRRKKQYLKATN